MHSIGGATLRLQLRPARYRSAIKIKITVRLEVVAGSILMCKTVHLRSAGMQSALRTASVEGRMVPVSRD